MQFKRNEIHELSIFLAIVQYRSFRKAADHLEVTASALSHSMKALEQRLGVRLLNRTSRSVAPTAAGTALAEKISAGLELINSGLEDLNGHYQGGAGSIRINVLKDAAVLLLRPAIPVFQQRFPNVELEVAVDDQFVDVTADGFDAGIRYSGTIPEDMIAVPLTPPLKWVAVAAPDYLRSHGRPVMPEDLNSHHCIRIRTGRGQIYKWEFERGDDRREIDVPGALISGETDLAINAALEGAGLCYCLERLASPYVSAGRLEVVLPKWASIGPPFSMYYSSRRQLPFGVDALIKIVRGLNGF
ncbi:LysR family transcriptional regulator [Rhizobium johnstonii]|uniref:HTH-type transcriptional regulator TtuA n=1 Tax=Rhizobium johnstonii (strain DSM 114642 / LMG 32736 / 3841) TaxID=216596 RepID=Q1M4Z9_RHIJ3|nr:MULTISPECIES: LysR family transcriptional regulator [Rhizobium]WSH12189.1 LysR family transcriptional regulator [Rhizobium johnstonii]MBB4508678.1 DNA-binding transcriptional LysR family regulator [Rhizobium leguminosarum]MBY3075267.1 LysR family transcriptional regulator [Rhizobium laguerreae]MBY5322888.1 LysR family transcriptional regulator [Rhizobium leguminosarum]MBY5379209.1 LysR family transcriptional regulator [Rhizobium leguminosarum]